MSKTTDKLQEAGDMAGGELNRLGRVIFEKPLLAWTGFMVAVLVCAYFAGGAVRDLRENERLSLLDTEVSRQSVDLMSTTLNGNLMGSVALLGLIDPEFKDEAMGKGPSKSAYIAPILESVGRSYDADGVFLVAANGIIGSSWDNSGKPSTGLNVKFRPYYQMAMQGMINVYAAVSLARGDRSLYFAAPIYIDKTNGTDAIGAVVARTGMLKVDELLRDKADIALLLSPQGVVFASSRKEWIGTLSGEATPERLKAIRELKQFGNMFEKTDPPLLPVSVASGVRLLEGKRFAVSRAPVQWNDPFGDWTLVLMEDLDRTVPLAQRLVVAGITAALLMALGALILKVLQSQHKQFLATRELAAMSRQQQTQAAHKEQVASAALRFQHAKARAELAQTFLSETHRIFGALRGAVYFAETDDPAMLTLCGAYACVDPPPAAIAIGEGLLGQCASERRTLLITDLLPGVADIHSGLGSTPPKAVFIAPILLKDQLMGAIELALLEVPDQSEQDRMMELAGLLGMNLEIIGRGVATEQTLSAILAEEQRQAERLAFQHALIDTIPYPVFYKGADARFLGVNRAYESTFQVNRSDLIGKRVVDLEYLPEADRRAYQAEDEATIAEVGSVQRDMKIPFADGQVHDTLYFASGFRLPNGQPGGLVGTFIDVSPLKKAENELARLSDADRFNRLAHDRESRILELKDEVNRLTEAHGGAPVYESAALEAIRVEAEAFATESGVALPGRLDDSPESQSIKELIASLRHERLAALSLAEDAEGARRALEQMTKESEK